MVLCASLSRWPLSFIKSGVDDRQHFRRSHLAPRLGGALIRINTPRSTSAVTSEVDASGTRRLIVYEYGQGLWQSCLPGRSCPVQRLRLLEPLCDIAEDRADTQQAAV